ncbi:GNAT family N-acetyltransferase [Rhizobium oryzicola]|uniref:GNAT family N-acetyltransferase n=1 Tax=Rhizobium oryzicola TaxID=1232668 RepID=A0ABT8STX9_9HYPH|nr:GNAT family N-acetyltransferase [Rhizobium oryzicola]MDO1581791.1 GNAT family N-acetyltransferase [Rhizobium oryzicola]
MRQEAEDAVDALASATDFNEAPDMAVTRAASPSPAAADAPLRVEQMTFSVANDMVAIETEWRALEALSANSLHQAYDWCRAWADAQGSELLLIKAEVNGRCVMLLPLEVMRQHGVRVVSYLGQGHNNFNTGLFASDFPALSQEEISLFKRQMRHVMSGKADMVLLEATPPVWRGVPHPLAGLTTIENPNHTFQLNLHRSFEATLAQLNAKRRRKKFRVQTRRLEEMGGYAHACPDTLEGQRDLLEAFFRQKGQRLRSQGLPDVFAPEDIRSFFRRLLEARTTNETYPLKLHAISLQGEHAGRIAAIAGLSRKGDHIICQFGAIDDSLAPETSPGELLFWLMIEQACYEGAALFDFGRGDQPYKRSWCNIETVAHDLMIAISWRGLLATQVHVATARAKAAIKRNPALYRFIQRLRTKDAAPATPTEAAD